MQETITIEYPNSLADTLKLNKQEFISELKISSMVKLFELGKVSSGTAAKVLGLSRVEFLELLGRYKVSPFESYNEETLNRDIANA